MQYRSPVYTEKTQCQDCYKCIRECPVKAIRVEGGHATILTDLCVLCGHCVTVCPAGAKRVRDDLDRARQLLRLKDRVFVSLAPSFASEFAEIDPAGLVRAIVGLGFAGVSETAIGPTSFPPSSPRTFAARRRATAANGLSCRPRAPSPSSTSSGTGPSSRPTSPTGRRPCSRTRASSGRGSATTSASCSLAPASRKTRGRRLGRDRLRDHLRRPSALARGNGHAVAAGRRGSQVDPGFVPRRAAKARSIRSTEG
jgi:NAD-dependent dihydropyrimidine dehydrogenase PreA subunit